MGQYLSQDNASTMRLAPNDTTAIRAATGSSSSKSTVDHGVWRGAVPTRYGPNLAWLAAERLQNSQPDGAHGYWMMKYFSAAQPVRRCMRILRPRRWSSNASISPRKTRPAKKRRPRAAIFADVQQSRGDVAYGAGSRERWRVSRLARLHTLTNTATARPEEVNTFTPSGLGQTPDAILGNPDLGTNYVMGKDALENGDGQHARHHRRVQQVSRVPVGDSKRFAGAGPAAVSCFGAKCEEGWHEYHTTSQTMDRARFTGGIVAAECCCSSRRSEEHESFPEVQQAVEQANAQDQPAALCRTRRRWNLLASTPQPLPAR